MSCQVSAVQPVAAGNCCRYNNSSWVGQLKSKVSDLCTGQQSREETVKSWLSLRLVSLLVWTGRTSEIQGCGLWLWRISKQNCFLFHFWPTPSHCSTMSDWVKLMLDGLRYFLLLFVSQWLCSKTPPRLSSTWSSHLSKCVSCAFTSLNLYEHVLYLSSTKQQTT